MENHPAKICCFRFDVDTHACVLQGMPRLMDLAESCDARFTFFVNPGRAFNQIITLRKLLRRLLDKTRTGKKRTGFIPAAAKLGFANSLTAILLNPRVASAAPPVLRVAGQDGHEVGLHGGTNHATWERDAHVWSKERLSVELAAGLVALQACGVGQPVSFASPGWNSPTHLAELLPELGLRILADSYNVGTWSPEWIGPRLVAVPTNITAPGSTAGYLEGMRARGANDAEIRADFRRQLASKEWFAGVYEHPFYAALHELPLLSDLLRIARDEGFAIRTVREASGLVPPAHRRGATALAS